MVLGCNVARSLPEGGEKMRRLVCAAALIATSRVTPWTSPPPLPHRSVAPANSLRSQIEMKLHNSRTQRRAAPGSAHCSPATPTDATTFLCLMNSFDCHLDSIKLLCINFWFALGKLHHYSCWCIFKECFHSLVF